MPEIHWHASVADEKSHQGLIQALAGGHFREPLILRGAADEWPAVCDASRRWTLSRLVSDHGGAVYKQKCQKDFAETPCQRF